MPRLLFVLGTRPEAIKLCPVITHLRSELSGFTVRVCATAQHRGLLDQVLAAFGVGPDHDLDLMSPGQTLSGLSSRLLTGLEAVIAHESPDMILVQGDTTTTFAGALAAFYARVPVAHVEAGLRTGDLHQPFPEEFNRVVTSRLAAQHFAPTEGAKRNLLGENVPEEQIHVTGNTGIDAVLQICSLLDCGKLQAPEWPWLDPARRLLVVTAHRRESFGQGMRDICEAVRELAHRPDTQIVFPVHPNPNVRQAVSEVLAGCRNIHILDPLGYVPFVDLMRRAYLLLTDSGGIQEEGPSLGKPILVLRDKTERPEAVEAGTVRLVGTCRDRIVSEAVRLLEDREEYCRRAVLHNPYGDGLARLRIGTALQAYFTMSP